MLTMYIIIYSDEPSRYVIRVLVSVSPHKLFLTTNPIICSWSDCKRVCDL